MLPRTIQEFLAQKKKQQSNINTSSMGKHTTRRDDISISEPPKTDNRKLTMLEDDDNW